MILKKESTLPIPQFIANYRNKSCYGFRSSTLAGWFFGDTFKWVPVSRLSVEIFAFCRGLDLTRTAQDGLLFHERFPHSVQGYRHHASLLGFW